MKPSLSAWLAPLPAALLLVSTVAADAAAPVVLRSFDQEPIGPLPAITHHTWTEQVRQQSDQFSRVEIVAVGNDGGRCCQISIGPTFPWGRRSEYRALTIGPDYLPPEADAVRLRVRAVAGRFVLTVGSPTVYFGHSDVLTERTAVDAAASTEWRTIELSLHHRLTRNQRRARFAAAAPTIYYTRWIQEPLYLYVARDSQGALQVDQVELIFRGEGRPYPTFPAEQLQQIKTIADFETPDDLRRAFTFFHEPVDLSRPPYLVRPDWKPARLTHVNAGTIGRNSLLIEQQGTEETCFAGVRTAAGDGADAVVVTLRAENDAGPEPLVIDFLVYTAPPRRRDELLSPRHEPPAAWKERPDMTFDYYLSQSQTAGESYAFYHVRRAFVRGEWTTLTLPFADFVCVYGQGEMAEAFQRQLPLTGAAIIAVGMTPPFRHRRAVTRIWLDELSYVKLPANSAEYRSFPQFAR